MYAHTPTHAHTSMQVKHCEAEAVARKELCCIITSIHSIYFEKVRTHTHTHTHTHTYRQSTVRLRQKLKRSQKRIQRPRNSQQK